VIREFFFYYVSPVILQSPFEHGCSHETNSYPAALHDTSDKSVQYNYPELVFLVAHITIGIDTFFDDYQLSIGAYSRVTFNLIRISNALIHKA
jgi:hypothetical protein